MWSLWDQEKLITLLFDYLVYVLYKGQMDFGDLRKCHHFNQIITLTTSIEIFLG